MYYKRWTRMHLKPGLKYFMKYGVIDPKLDKFSYVMATENPSPLHHRRLNPIKHNQDKDLDTKLINQLFLKYPDLQYEPISQKRYPGQPFNTFSYAYAFIDQQKKYIRQGYTISKAFELTEEEYHQKMQRKLDQSLLSRGLAFGNRARSFLNVYQQQAEYEARLKTQRTQRQLEKYDLKLAAIRETVDPEQTGASSFLSEQALSHERIFFSVSEHNRPIDDNGPISPVDFQEIPKTDSKDRTEFIKNVQTKFRHLFSSFYTHAATKDKLQGLSDAEIISQIQSSPSKIKRNTRKLMKYLENRNIKISLENGKIIVSGTNSDTISQKIRSNKYLKIALLSESLQFEKPNYSSVQNPTKNSQLSRQIFKEKSALHEARPDRLKKEDRELIKINKQRQLNLVSNEDLDYNREAYKILETEEERMLRLQIKYYDMLIAGVQKNRQPVEEGQEETDKLSELQAQRTTAVQDFRRLKFRLEKRYREISADDLLFPEHKQIQKELKFESEVEYEELLGYLRKKNDERRLTSLSQSKDNKVNATIRVLNIAEGAIPQGAIPPGAK